MIRKYRLHCITENLDKYWNLEEGSPPPTTCPTNSAHTIDPSSITVVQIGTVTEVVTQYEKNDKDLKLAKLKGVVGNDGSAIVEIKIPGVFGSGDGRFVAGGYGITDDYNADDFVTIWVEDKDRALALFLAKQINNAATDPLSDQTVQEMGNIPGLGSFPEYPIVKTYTDDEVPSESQGWFFWPIAMGNSIPPIGEVEIEPIGGYAFIPSGLYIKIVYQRPGNIITGTIRVNIEWGKKE